MPKEAEIAVWILLAVWLLANSAALLRNRFLFPRRRDVTSARTLLVVVAHQDDEVICAGGAMLKTIAKGGNVHVVYTVDGAPPNPDMTEDLLRERIAAREQESINCLADLGIPKQNAHFLRYLSERGLHSPANAMKAIAEISQLIRQLEPYAIVTSAFEGGHCDHDMTNFIVARAAEQPAFPRDRVFEAPEYNRYYLREYLMRKANHFLLFQFKLPPRFLPANDTGFALDLSADELQRKKSLYRHFVS